MQLFTSLINKSKHAALAFNANARMHRSTLGFGFEKVWYEVFTREAEKYFANLQNERGVAYKKIFFNKLASVVHPSKTYYHRFTSAIFSNDLRGNQEIMHVLQQFFPESQEFSDIKQALAEFLPVANPAVNRENRNRSQNQDRNQNPLLQNIMVFSFAGTSVDILSSLKFLNQIPDLKRAILLPRCQMASTLKWVCLILWLFSPKHPNSHS
jgi:hypothetical protein